MIVYYTKREQYISKLYDALIEPYFLEYEEKIAAWVEAGRPASRLEEVKQWYDALWEQITPILKRSQKYLKRITKRHFDRLEKLPRNQRK